MIDFKATLIKLHDTFPEYDFDTVIKITECIVEYPSGIKRPVLDEFLYKFADNSDKWIEYHNRGVKIIYTPLNK